MNQFIYCTTMDEFLDVIHGLVVRGLAFKANYDTFSITLLGGY